MGSDDLFHKRKSKTERDLRRSRACRAVYEKVLIVCEGSKTEPLYFGEIKDAYEISTANIRISGDCGSDPLSVVRHGEQLYAEERRRNPDDPYDRVYFVFDKDSHPGYQKALEKIESMRPKGVFHAVPSIPSFEYWLLLHYEYTTAAFVRSGNKSAGDMVIASLRKYWPDYAKGAENVFSHLFDQLAFAKANAARSQSEAIRSGSDNPSTQIHCLVDYLQKIKEGGGPCR